MAGWLWVGVVIDMPAFTEGQQSDPKTISEVSAGGEPARPPHVSGGVN